ncbi:MAG: TetR/AcrR family transcriptional regulator [Myxococcota bacterium]|nr:TetR/AcrR family transcriptional regulator [Myxococcota bacterium]
MPRSPADNARMRAQTRRALLDAALEVAAERGFHGASIARIAERAGVSKALVFKHFASKDKLLEALLEAGLQGVGQAFSSAQQATSPQQRLRALIAPGFAFVREHPRFWRLISQLRMQDGVQRGLGAALPATTQGITRQIEAELRALGTPDPELDARVLWAAIDGATQHYLLDPQGYPLEAVQERLIAMYLELGSTGGTQ